MCEKRFSPLSDHTRERIDSADLDTLLGWAENVAVAATLNDDDDDDDVDVFGGPPA